jgi:hypothetical protein
MNSLEGQTLPWYKAQQAASESRRMDVAKINPQWAQKFQQPLWRQLL